MIDKSNTNHVVIKVNGYNDYQIPQVDNRRRGGWAMLVALKEAYGIGVFTGTKVVDGTPAPIYVDTYNMTWGDRMSDQEFVDRRTAVEAAIARVNANA